MTAVLDYPMTRQGVRDLDNPIRPGRAKGRVNVGSKERALSAVGGAILAGFGLGQGGLAGLLLAAAGGALAYRGVTGHCSAFAAAGIDTAH